MLLTASLAPSRVSFWRSGVDVCEDLSLTTLETTHAPRLYKTYVLHTAPSRERLANYRPAVIVNPCAVAASAVERWAALASRRVERLEILFESVTSSQRVALKR